jgi:hypothetical protein
MPFAAPDASPVHPRPPSAPSECAGLYQLERDGHYSTLPYASEVEDLFLATDRGGRV